MAVTIRPPTRAPPPTAHPSARTSATAAEVDRPSTATAPTTTGHSSQRNRRDGPPAQASAARKGAGLTPRPVSARGCSAGGGSLSSAVVSGFAAATTAGGTTGGGETISAAGAG